MIETVVEKVIPGIVFFGIGIALLKNRDCIVKKMIQKTWRPFVSNTNYGTDVTFGNILLIVLSVGLIIGGLVLLYRAGLAFFNI